MAGLREMHPAIAKKVVSGFMDGRRESAHRQGKPYTQTISESDSNRTGGNRTGQMRRAAAKRAGGGKTLLGG